MRVACLLILHLPVQVERRRNPALTDAPLVVGGRRWDAGAVLDCCTQAAAAGVEPGMRLSQAEALCPEARFLPADRAAYDVVHRMLIDGAKRFTPIVETVDLGLVLVEVSSLKRRFDDEAELAHHLTHEMINGSGLDVRVGLGSGRFLAEQAAHAAQPGEVYFVSSEEERAFLSPLDISTLPLDPEMERRLRLLGVRTLGALAKLPRLAVVRQFGSQAGPLHDIACGIDALPVHADAPPLQLSGAHAFVNPVRDRTSLLTHVERLTDDFAEELNRRGYQAEGIRLEIEEVCGERHTIGRSVKPPSSSADQLSRLSARMVERLDISGPLADLSITIYPLRPLHLGTTQLPLFSSDRTEGVSTFDRRLRETLRQLWGRFGKLSVVVASLIMPPQPCPIQVTTARDGLPRAIVWHKRLRKVRRVHELWRERKQWWGQSIERDYFRLELDDGQMRVVFREGQANQWLLERRHI